VQHRLRQSDIAISEGTAAGIRRGVPHFV